MTIQQAMRQLIVEGLIYTRKGQGTFVRKNFLQLSQWELPGSDYFGATKTWEHLGEVQSEVVRFAVRFPSDKEQSSLLIDADAPVYDFVRLRLLNGEPVSLDLTVMPVGLVPGLTKSHLEGSVFRYVQETLGLKLMGSYRVVRAMKPGNWINSIFTANRPIRCWRWIRLSIWRMARRWSTPTVIIATITAGLFW